MDMCTSLRGVATLVEGLDYPEYWMDYINMAAFRGELNRALTRARQLGYQRPMARQSAPVIGV